MADDILIVDDEKDICDLMADIFQDEHYTTRTALSSDTALESLAERIPSVVFLDIWLQGSELDGLGVLELIRDKYPAVPVIMISGHGTIETAVSAIKLGAYDFVEKPFKEEQLLHVVKRALEARKLKLENQELRVRSHSDGELVGSATVMQQLRQQIERVAPTNSRVFITGPAGSGKELTARCIHRASQRSNAPFAVLNAASMAPERVERELFGEEDTQSHSGGARTLGVLERAHGGTLFIDEVGDMPLATQAKILRMLQEQSFERLGGTRRIQVDVRVMAASSRDLRKLIEQGKFREDLFYRLNVVPIPIPALKERRDDISALCQYFIRRAADGSGLMPRKIGKEAMALLEAYQWPGNVRQLRNVIEWLLIMAPGEPETPIRANMLPAELFDGTPVAQMPGLGAEIMSLPLKEAREQFERQYLKSQISRFGGNISKTSTYIGMERSALHRKLKMLELTSEERV